MAHLIIIGADKGGVGKTTVARLLLDYLKARGVRPSVYDTEPEPGVLRRFHSYAKSVDVTAARGQMQVFDDAPRQQTTVVDLRAGGLSRVLAAMRDAGLLRVVHDGGLRMTVMHVLGPAEASLRELAPTREILRDGGDHLVVRNRVVEGTFETVGDARAIDISHLDDVATETLDRVGATLHDFCGDATQSMWLRGMVRHWAGLAHAEFDRAAVI